MVGHVPAHLVLDVYSVAFFDGHDGATANRDNNSAHGAQRARVAIECLACVVAPGQLLYEATLFTAVYEHKRAVLAIVIVCAAKLEVREVFVLLESFAEFPAFGNFGPDIPTSTAKD